jgi:hypothetical protein
MIYALRQHKFVEECYKYTNVMKTCVILLLNSTIPLFFIMLMRPIIDFVSKKKNFRDIISGSKYDNIYFSCLFGNGSLVSDKNSY